LRARRMRACIAGRNATEYKPAADNGLANPIEMT
jgi:hypothetical protein